MPHHASAARGLQKKQLARGGQRFTFCTAASIGCMRTRAENAKAVAAATGYHKTPKGGRTHPIASTSSPVARTSKRGGDGGSSACSAESTTFASALASASVFANESANITGVNADHRSSQAGASNVASSQMPMEQQIVAVVDVTQKCAPREGTPCTVHLLSPPAHACQLTHLCAHA